MMINEFYHIDGKYHHILRNYMRSKLNESQYMRCVKWYKKTYNREAIEYFKKEYYSSLQKLEELLTFPEQFITNFLNVKQDDIIMILENYNQNWKFTNGRTV